jgi:hypothetical protein
MMVYYVPASKLYKNPEDTRLGSLVSFPGLGLEEEFSMKEYHASRGYWKSVASGFYYFN